MMPRHPDEQPACTGRLTKKERRQTLTEELLADQTLQQAHKRRFAKLQVRFWILLSGVVCLQSCAA
jgi:Fcf2 pre-rRNA processing